MMGEQTLVYNFALVKDHLSCTLASSVPTAARWETLIAQSTDNR